MAKTFEQLSATGAELGSGLVCRIHVSDGGVPKRPVESAFVSHTGLVGDRQRNRRYHGGPDRAVCLWSLEVIEDLRAEGHLVFPGATGENLTIRAIEWSLLKPGVHLQVGEDVQLEISSYTRPCKTNAQWFTNGYFSRISQDRHPGWSRIYARVLAEGVVRREDSVQFLNPHKGSRPVMRELLSKTLRT